MTNSSFSKTEIAILYVTFGLLIFGIVMARLDQFWFNFTYVVEDGFIEWMTVLPLILMVFICFKRIKQLYKYRPPLFICSLGVLAVLCFFAAGEELSWGQRLFQWRSTDFFVHNNSQKETNIHNLVVAGKSVNILIFSRLLIFGMVLYLIVLPLIYRRNELVRKLTEKFALPIPQLYQIVSLCLVFGLISLCPSEKKAELLEFGTCFIFLAIFLYPANSHIFKS